MSTCAVMLVRDEEDIIEQVVKHLLWHVDEVIVADNNSVDGTREILESLPVEIRDDPEPGYWQSRKTTALAMEAMERGHWWVVPCDADEVWHPGDVDMRIADFLAMQNPDVMRVEAPILNHFQTTEDRPDSWPPVTRLCWRKKLPNGVKMAARLRPDMTIQMGNHDVTYEGMPGIRVGGLFVRHFSWRSEDLYVRKVRAGIEAYNAAPGIGDQFGVGWRQYEHRPDDAIRGWYKQWAFVREPMKHLDELIMDPAPLRGQD